MTKPVTQAKRAARGPISLRIMLRTIKPPIWRRILVPGGMTLADLHVAIQVAMGWENGHLHAFDIAGERYGERGTLDNCADEGSMTLNKLVNQGVSHFRYTYDFGDDWEHDILIEDAPPKIKGVTALPACVDGARHCPPEDCGGSFGYEDLLDVLRNPDDPNHAEQREWLGDDFDPEAFSVAAADAALAQVFRRKGR
jgi:hypothetical protein